MTDCIFCRIVAGEIPSTRVAQTDRIYAFRDIEPHAPTHVLLIPKSHVADSAAEIDEADGPWLSELYELAAQIAESEGLSEGWRIITNVGPAAGQTVFHVHFHLMGGWADR